MGEFGAAIPQLEKALQLDPSLQYAHYHLGLSYFQEQRYPEALSELQRAAQFDPQNAAVQFYQGYTLYQLKRYREALAPFERAIALDPALALSAQYYRGLTLFALENDTQARAAFEAAQTADPTSTIGQNATRYLEALKARERDRRLWQVEGSASLQYDSNVILQGTLPTTLAISSQADGARCSMPPVGSLPRVHRCGRRERNTIFFKTSILPCMTLIFGATPSGCLGARNLIR